MNIKLALFTTAILALISIVSAEPTPTPLPVTPLVSWVTLTIRLGNVFCLHLPYKQGRTIAQSLRRTLVYCTCTPPDPFTAHRILPEGFIRSVHFDEHPDKRYVQVTGRFDREKFGFSSSDQGGQSDPSVRTSSRCYGYKYYVQLIEPDVQEYCLRCCNYAEDCPTNKATMGCRNVIPGKYD